jgi:predicted component of type VI protein secretion system
MQTVLRQLSRMQQARHCTAALPAPLDSLTAAAAPLQQDQVAAAITIAVALAWVKMFAVLTSSGVLEQVMVCIKQQRVLHARLSLAN